LFFLCPVMYFIEAIGSNDVIVNNPTLFKLYSLNPVADLSVAYRKILLAPQPIPVSQHGVMVMVDPYPLNWGQIAYSAVFSVVVFIFGYRTFNRMKSRFVERA
jgi:ABC-type polysaccharide/polyol phosphate export permease